MVRVAPPLNMTCAMDDSWLQIDERTDVLVSLSLCLKCLRGLGDDRALWKWAILSLHSALQGAMVCHLSGTAQLGALFGNSVRKWLDWHERDRRGEIKYVDDGVDELGMRRTRIATVEDNPPDSRLADPRTLFKRLYSQDERRETAGTVIPITQAECGSFYRLCDLRDEFTHFTPKGWSIELDGLPGTFLDMVGVLEKISSDPWPFRHMTEEESAKLGSLLQQLRTELEQM